MPVLSMNKKRKRVFIARTNDTRTSDNSKRDDGQIEEITIDDDELDNEPSGKGIDEAIRNEIEKHLKEVKLEETVETKQAIVQMDTFDRVVFDKIIRKELEKHVEDVQKQTDLKLKQYEKMISKEKATSRRINENCISLELKVADLEKKNVNLEKYNAFAKVSNEELVIEVKSISNKYSKILAECKEKLMISERKVAETQKKLIDTERKLTEMEERPDKTEEELNTDKATHDEIKEKLHDSDEKLRETEGKLFEADEKYNDMQEKLNETESKLLVSESNLAKVEENLSNAETRCNESERHFKLRLANKDNLLKNVETQSEEHRQVLINQYESKCYELNSIETNLKAQSETLASKIDRFEKILILKDDSIKTFKVKMDKLTAENNALTEKEADFSFTMNNKVKANLDQLKEDHEELRKDRNEKNIEIDKLKVVKETYERKCQDMAQVNCELELALKTKDYESELFQKKLSDIGGEKDALFKTLKKMEDSCEKHIMELQARKETLDSLKVQEAELKLLKDKNEKLERKKSGYKKSEKKLEKELLTLKTQIYFPKPSSYNIPKIKREEDQDQRSNDKNKDILGNAKPMVGLKDDKPKKSKTLESVLLVSNIDYAVTRKDLEYLFKTFGKKNGFKVKLPKPAAEIDSSDIQVHANRGVGWVTFNNKDDALKAIKETNKLEFHGKKLIVGMNKLF